MAEMGDCFVQSVENGVPISRYIGDRACVAFGPERLFHGVFVDGFEDEAYYDGATTLADIRGWRSTVWFSTDAETRGIGLLVEPRYRGRAYRITFRGRAARDMNRRPMEGYGHLNMSPGLVLADEIVEAVDLGLIAF